MKTTTKSRKNHDMVVSGSGNVFSDLGLPAGEAADLKIKAALLVQFHGRVKELRLTQVRAAERLGISQPDVSKLMNGRIDGYSVERLLSLLNALEVDVDIIVRPRPHGKKVQPGVVRVLDANAA